MQPADGARENIFVKTRRKGCRILVADDMPEAYEQLRRVLDPELADEGGSGAALAADILGKDIQEPSFRPDYLLDYASGGRRAQAMLERARKEGDPYALVFMDMHMPPGWDGLETIRQVWKTHPLVEMILCSAYADVTWEKVVKKLGVTNRLMFLRKPFDVLTVRQMVLSLTTKWDISQRLRDHVDQLRREKESLESRLLQAQKMETIGTLTGGIAHDFNNILEVILGFTDLVRQDLPDDELIRANLAEVARAGWRAKDLVQQILTYTRQSSQEKRPVQVQLIVKEVLKLMRASLPKTIAIKQNVEPDCGMVLADPTQIHQVLMNLCTNAYQAMGNEGGVLEVSLEAVFVDGKGIPGCPTMAGGTYCRIRVEDTGQGISEEVLKKIFDPFFTTKKAGEGTGLGLSVVKGIMGNHGGAISVSSREGVGSTFQVYFPTMKSEEIRNDPRPQPPPSGRERILVIDDEAPLVEMLKQTLERLGYEVSAHTIGAEALGTFRKRPECCDLVVTDLAMPGMSGVELAEEFRRIRPGIPVILATGFSDLVTPEKAEALGFCAYLMKPVLSRDLALTVRRVLDGDKISRRRE